MPPTDASLAKAALEASRPSFYPPDLPPDAQITHYTSPKSGATHDILPPTATCNGHLIRPGYCSNRAGQWTTHDGAGRCVKHDMSRAHLANTRYTALQETTIGILADEIAAYDDDPTNITDELTLARALFVDWIQRYQEFSEALLAWHASFATGRAAPKPARILDITQASQQIRVIAQLAQQLEDSRLRDALSQGELIAILQEVSRSTEATVTTCPHCHGSLQPVLDAIKGAWGGINLWHRHAPGHGYRGP